MSVLLCIVSSVHVIECIGFLADRLIERERDTHVMWRTRRLCRAFVGMVPNKGYRPKPEVPDRLRDAFCYFGCDAINFNTDDIPFQNEQKRHGMVKDVMSQNRNMVSLSKLDKLEISLRRVKGKPANASDWDEAIMNFRMSYLCVEIVPDQNDTFPKGEKLWIDLDTCTERRRPYCIQFENGITALPVFTFEDHADHYFQRMKVWDSCWFPHPRVGTQLEVFQKLNFPVMANGPMNKIAMLATMAVPSRQFIVAVNPFQEHTKFLTYQEMLHIVKAKGPDGSVLLSSSALKRTFNTSKWSGTRIDPMSLPKDEGAVPQIAQDELKLLLFEFVAVEAIYIRSYSNSMWKRLRTSKDKTTEILVKLSEGFDFPDELPDRIASWSYIQEAKSDIQMNSVKAVPEDALLVYDEQSVMTLRKSAHRSGPSVREAVGYEVPLDAPIETAIRPEQQTAK